MVLGDDTQYVESAMKFLFDDESFHSRRCGPRGFTVCGGADLGEVLVTADGITSGDEASRHRA